jgi:hypothetical protein
MTAFLEAHPWIGVLLGGLVGAVLGSGALWSFLQYRIAKRTQGLSAAKTLGELHKELSDKLVRLIELSKQYASLRDAEAASGRTRENQDRPNEMLRLKAQIELLETDVLAAEARLAKLEKRPPRPIQVQWIPPSAPTGLRIVSIEYTPDAPNA